MFDCRVSLLCKANITIICVLIILVVVSVFSFWFTRKWSWGFLIRNFLGRNFLGRHFIGIKFIGRNLKLISFSSILFLIFAIFYAQTRKEVWEGQFQIVIANKINKSPNTDAQFANLIGLNLSIENREMKNKIKIQMYIIL